MKDIVSNNITIKLNNSLYDGDDGSAYEQILLGLIKKYRDRPGYIFLGTFSLSLLLLIYIFHVYPNTTFANIYVLLFFVANYIFIFILQKYQRIDRKDIYSFSNFRACTPKNINAIPTAVLLNDYIKVLDVVKKNGHYAFEVENTYWKKEPRIEYYGFHVDLLSSTKRPKGKNIYIDLNENILEIGEDREIRNICV